MVCIYLANQSRFLAGLISLHTNAPLPISVPRAKGFNMGLVAVLELPEHVAGYAAHPAHLEWVFSFPFQSIFFCRIR